MTKKRDLDRLGKMFSDLEVLAVNPAKHTLEIQSEIASSQLADLQALPLEHEDVVLEADVGPENPPGGQVSLDEELAPRADLTDETEILLDSPVPLTDISNDIPPALTSEAETLGEAPIVQPRIGPVRADESNPVDWPAVGIGILTGALVTGVILVSTSHMNIFNHVGRLFLLGWEVLCGIIGALAAQSSKKTRREIWVGAIQWALVPVWIAGLIISLIYLLMFTNLFGV